ncbi:hypothetical protein G9A89_000337 [Geosiphon pyriformis]|nr:hypothetical protein G9A89_000337 [Geosiphon pyriformis]
MLPYIGSWINRTDVLAAAAHRCIVIMMLSIYLVSTLGYNSEYDSLSRFTFVYIAFTHLSTIRESIDVDSLGKYTCRSSVRHKTLSTFSKLLREEMDPHANLSASPNPDHKGPFDVKLPLGGEIRYLINPTTSFFGHNPCLGTPLIGLDLRDWDAELRHPLSTRHQWIRNYQIIPLILGTYHIPCRDAPVGAANHAQAARTRMIKEDSYPGNMLVVGACPVVVFYLLLYHSVCRVLLVVVWAPPPYPPPAYNCSTHLPLTAATFPPPNHPYSPSSPMDPRASLEAPDLKMLGWHTLMMMGISLPSTHYLEATI